jgi:hypothetical protein
MPVCASLGTARAQHISNQFAIGRANGLRQFQDYQSAGKDAAAAREQGSDEMISDFIRLLNQLIASPRFRR